MTGYLGEMWKCRYFWMSLVKIDLRARYKRSILGMGWSLLHPIAMTTVLCIVFANLFGVPIKEFGPYVMSGLAIWAFLVGSVTIGCHTFHMAEAYIRQHPAPLAIYPLRTALGYLIHFLIALALVVTLQWVLNGPGNILVLVSLLPAILTISIFVFALTLLAGLSNVYFPDTKHLTEVVFQILFYASPIMWPERLVREKGLGWLIDYNPLAYFFELVRAPILYGEPASLVAVVAAVGSTLVALLIAILALARLHRTFIFQL